VVSKYFKILEDLPKANEGRIEYPINLAQLQVDHLLSQDLVNQNKNILLTKDTIIESQHIDKLKKLEADQNTTFTLFIKK